MPRMPSAASLVASMPGSEPFATASGYTSLPSWQTSTSVRSWLIPLPHPQLESAYPS